MRHSRGTASLVWVLAALALAHTANAAGLFAFKAPNGWVKVPAPRMQRVKLPPRMHIIEAYSQPGASRKTTFEQNINLLFDETPLAPDAYFQRAIASLRAQHFDVKRPAKITCNGTPGIEVTYATAGGPSNGLAYVQTLVPAPRGFYIATYTREAGQTPLAAAVTAIETFCPR